ncbi:MAG TPA: M1 family aminopeptidase [Pyrinomonadaceae bacterium]|nr:M1 family aminopeptidase [Pyrinomonadaceae bacterium]
MKAVLFLALSFLAPSFGGPATYLRAQDDSAQQFARYDLSIKVLPDARRIQVTGTVSLPPANQERDKIEFLLWSRMEKLTAQLLEPKIAAPAARLDNDGSDGDRKWTLRLVRPVPAGQFALVQFSYVSAVEPSPQFNISPEGSFAGGGGELWYPQTSFSNRETGTIRFLVPTGETVISNGRLLGTAEQRARGEFIFQIAQPSKFGFASGKYTVTRRAGKTPFALYLLRPSKRAGQILDGCASALNFLTRLFGTFPYREFSLVEVDFRSKVLGTSEFGFILADASVFDKDFDLSYWAHEIGHQWWGDLIRTKSGTTGRMMLSEGVAQFGALLATEKLEGHQAAERFRRTGYQPSGQGQSAATYFRLATTRKDFPLTTYEPKNQNDTLTMHTLANSKGFILLDMLSRRIGRAKFAAILRRFVKEKANQITSWQEFQRAIEAGAGQDIRWFFEQWFERTGAPDYQLTWEQSGKVVRVVVRQPAPYYRANLEVELSGTGRRLLKTVEIVGEQISFEWIVPFKVDSVVLDPHYKVLRWMPEFRPQ